ncbi:hypothetical protein [Agromyces humi]|uniref:hypothetical protein n=1 Tax=Agromyces humi TaxID=1766800 RepID=UPI001357B3B2|nr:hypothetical protein [Agromyces humi]
MTATLERRRVDTLQEMDFDGEPGTVIGFLIDGHVGLDDVDMFVATELAEHFWDGGPARGFDVDHVFWRAVPFVDEEGEPVAGSFTYAYDPDASRGGRAATRVEANNDWERWCANHPDELAALGMPAYRVVEEDHDLLVDGYVWMCDPCHDRFEQRIAAERNTQMRSPHTEAV